MNKGDLKEAWRKLQGWYRTAEGRAPTPCRETMDKQTKEREELYVKVLPHGDLTPINVEPFPVQDEIPEDAEIREIVGELQNGRAGGASKIRAEDIKSWLRGIREEEENGREGAGVYW